MIKKRILTVSGSASDHSSNTLLLLALAGLTDAYDFIHFQSLSTLPLYTPMEDRAPWPHEVNDWRQAVRMADAIVISTPEYLHNIPAHLKNALEWLSTSGEMAAKAVLTITYTPHAPRGERAMQSLIWSLTALNARIVAQMPLYQDENPIINGSFTDPVTEELLLEALKLL